MALSKDSVKKAIEILKQVYPGYQAIGKFSDVTLYKEFPVIPGIIVCLDEKTDGGFENVYIDIKYIDESTLEKFHELKKQIRNSPIEREHGESITRIGWF